MPNDYVDLGYYAHWWWGGLNFDLSAQDAYWLDIHSRVKSKLEAENAGQNWAVDRLFKWTSGAEVAFGFVVRHLDGAGASTGREWLVSAMGSQSVTLWSDVYTMWGGHGWVDYFRPAHFLNALSANGIYGGYALHYHSGGLSTTYDVGVGVDLDPPNTLPSVNAAGFMPDPIVKPWPRGGYLEADSLSTGHANYMCMVYNHEKPFIQLMLGEKSTTAPKAILIAGDILICREASDPYVEGCLSYYIPVPSDSAAYINLDYRQGCHVVDSAGNRDTIEGIVYSLVSSDKVSDRYQPNATGDFDRIPIRVAYTDNSYDKGYVDPDVSHFGGPDGRYRGHTFPSQQGKMLKVEDTLLVPWVAGVPAPFVGWPLNPQQRPQE